MINEQEQQIHTLNRKVEFLHEDNQQLRFNIEDLKVVIGLNKNQIRSLLIMDDEDAPKKPNVNKSMCVENKTIRNGQYENKLKALSFVIDDKDREILHLMGALEKVQKERDFAQGKTLINEEISYQAERQEYLMIKSLEGNIQDLNNIIHTQGEKIMSLEKQSSEEQSGIIIKYREVLQVNSQTILMHEEMEQFHGLTVKLQMQVNYLKSIQVKLIKMIHQLISSITDSNDVEDTVQRIQQEFIQTLEMLQKSTYMHIEVPVKTSLTSPMNQNNQTDLHSPILSPFPNKVVAPQKKSNFLNQTFDLGQIGQINDNPNKNIIPKLNLDKAFQIQQINAKRSTQQSKMTEEMLIVKFKKLEVEFEDCKKNLQREMLLSKHFEIDNEQMKRYINQIESNNEILIKSNLNFQDKWQRIQKGYIFYKTFFVEHKDQFQNLKNLVNLVESEKERFTFNDESPGCNSARIDIKKETTKRKRNDLNKTQNPMNHNTQQGFLDISSLIDVEREMNRKYLQYSQSLHIAQFDSDYQQEIQNENIQDQDLGNACMDRTDSLSAEPLQDWREDMKKQWSQIAIQVYNNRQKDIVQVQRVKSIQIHHLRAHSVQRS